MSRTIQLERLKKREAFRRVRAGRRHVAMPGLVLQARDAPAGVAADSARVGFTVSRRVGNAVKRSRARRRLKAAAAEVLPAQAVPRTDYVLIGRQRTLDRPFPALKGDLEAALGKLGLRRAEAA